MSIRSITICPSTFLSLAKFFSQYPGTILLYSGGKHNLSNYSYLGVFPCETISIHQKSLDPWEELKKRLGRFDADATRIPKWMGFFSYPMAEMGDAEKRIAMPSTTFPLAYFQRYRQVFVYNHYLGKLEVHGEDLEEDFLDVEVESSIGQAEKVQMGEKRADYLEKIHEIKRYLRNGDIYQLNYSHSFIFEGDVSPFALFEKLNQKNPAPYSAYLGMEEFSIVSSSPELFLQKIGNRIETRPIKGTIPRGRTKEEDLRNRLTLLTSEKERAELTMITDLLRNDLGRFSQVGSVRVMDPYVLEKYANVFHLASIIESEVSILKHPLDIIRKCFPGGSITGCPKLRSMELINQFEKSSRDIYTGSIGLFFENGDFSWNIAIRTLQFCQEKITARLGGAIVMDSIPEKEYEETLHKGETIFQALCT